MDLPEPLQRAIARLNGALDALDAAAERRAEADAGHAASEDDRTRLAVERDDALARAHALDRVAGDVAARVERAGATVRGILAELQQPAGPVPPGRA